MVRGTTNALDFLERKEPGGGWTPRAWQSRRKLECRKTVSEASVVARRKTSKNDKIDERHREACAKTTGSSRCTCNNVVYRARAWDPKAKERVARQFQTREAAEEWLERVEKAIKAGLMRAEQPVTFREAANRWAADAEAGVALTRDGVPYKPSAVRSYRAAIDERLEPRFGSRRLRDIERRDVQAFVDELVRDGLAPQTIRNALLPLRVIFRRALALEEVEVNPTLGVQLPAPKSQPRAIVDAPTAAKMLDAIDEKRDRAIYATAVYAGLRRGELMALRWDDVDLLAGVIRVTRAWDPKARVFVTPKSARGTRSVGIPPVLARYLAAWKDAAPTETGLAFGDTMTEPFRDDALATRARAAWTKAGLPDITLHGGRHTFVTLLAEAGAPIDAIQHAAGHSSITVTMDRYRHAVDDSASRTAKTFQTYIEAAAKAATDDPRGPTA